MDDDRLPDDNPAVKALMPALTPSALMEAMEDPDVFPPLARGILYEQMVGLRTLMQNSAVPISQRLDLAKFLAKVGKVETPEKTGPNPYEALPTINMIFPNAGRKVEIGGRPVIDVTPDPSDE